jgi:hypothetical protein
MYNKKSSCCQPPPGGQRNSSCCTQLSIPLNDDPYLNHGIRFQTAEGFTIALKLTRDRTGKFINHLYSIVLGH